MDELEKIIEGMLAENQALMDNNQRLKYSDADFKAVRDELLVGGMLPEVEVKGEIEEKDDQSESARLMANYRLKDETDEDLYSRITPKEEVVYENIYSPINKGVIPKKVTKITIDGITKSKHTSLPNIYTNEHGEQASPEEILKFEELTTLNNIHN
jgi:hypothetical protein